MSENLAQTNPFARRAARRVLRRLERWTKIVGITAAVFGIVWTAWTYALESDARNFDQRQKAWAIINAHSKGVVCFWETEIAPHSRDHTNTGQIDAVEFLASQGKSMSGIGLPCSEFSGLRAPGAHLSNTRFWQSNFTKVDLSNAELSYAKLAFSHVSGANLANADLTHAVLNGVSAHWANFGGAKMMYSTLIASDLSNADFHEADLSHADLRFAQLTNANFTGANLDGVNLTGACYRTLAEIKGEFSGPPKGWSRASPTLPVCPLDWKRPENDDHLVALFGPITSAL